MAAVIIKFPTPSNRRLGASPKPAEAPPPYYQYLTPVQAVAYSEREDMALAANMPWVRRGWSMAMEEPPIWEF